MAELKIRAEHRDGHDTFWLSGNIVAGARERLAAATKRAGRRCTINWAGITITSSDGIRDWVYFLDDFAQGREVSFAECPPSIVISFNMFPRCLGPAKVVSAYGTFVCTLCHRERSELLTIGKDVAMDGSLKTPITCESCGHEMHLNLPPSEYFGFLST